MASVYKVFQFIIANLYLRFLFIIAVSFIVAFLAKIVMKKILYPLTKRTKTKIDDLIVASVSSVIFYFILFLGVRLGIGYFKPPQVILISLVDSLLIVIFTLTLLKIINGFSKQWMKDWKSKTKTTVDDRLIPLVQKVLKAIVMILAVIFIFSAWKVNISPLIAATGIAGIAVSFAVKDSLTNILGGLQLVLDKTFMVGDKVQLDSGEMGVILDIGLRSTKLKTFDNEVIYIPNGNLANAKIKNFTQPDLSVRVNVDFGVEYGSDSEKVKDVVLKAISKIEGVLDDPPPAVIFIKMSDFSLDFIARVWVGSYTEAFSTKLKMTDEIYEALNKAGIGIPFPTRTIYTKQLD